MIEIWSNEEKTEFAIKISKEDSFKATTNAHEEYELLIDSVPYFPDLEYKNWKFTLDQWITRHKYKGKGRKNHRYN